jgi:hypothetical protein
VAREKELAALKERWASRWEEALAVWSRFTKLSEPRWCLTESQEKDEKLFDSFAMIRLTDHAVAISLRQVKDRGLERFPVEVLAHEIGHHVYAPADLTDNARLIARTRAGLPSREALAGLVANLYTDLLINDRLQRDAGLKMAEVYKALRNPLSDRLWTLYMRIYETLWSLPLGTLAGGKMDEQIRNDAHLGSRVVRVYAKEWLRGAGRFAALLLPYLLDPEREKAAAGLGGWLDTQQAGAGGQVPDGLAEIDEDEADGAIHPSEDPAITGLGQTSDAEHPGGGPGRELRGGQKNQYRDPTQYVELMKSLGVTIPEDQLVIRYYRERALPHLIRFPVREIREVQDPLPEGLEEWDPGSPIQEVDWSESLSRSPVVIPGVTTVRRVYGTSEGTSPEKIPVDLYLGVDCSGSMLNPKYGLSYPVLAGAIIVLSALRTGAKVMACLSGEPGQYTNTRGFTRNEQEVMKTLTGYLGTGYSYGILRLKEAFLAGVYEVERPTHILIVTDSDIFHMLGEVKDGYDIARDALAAAQGGGTFILHMGGPGSYPNQIKRLQSFGWDVHYVSDWANLLAFARAFSKAKWGKEENRASPQRTQRARRKTRGRKG